MTYLTQTVLLQLNLLFISCRFEPITFSMGVGHIADLNL